jgi:uncharacterized membrane protein (Fun14 family)
MNVSDYAPFLGTIGGGFVAGALAGYAIKKIMKIAAVIVGLFITALAYLQYQGIIHVDWVKFQTVSLDGLTAITNTIMNMSKSVKKSCACNTSPRKCWMIGHFASRRNSVGICTNDRQAGECFPNSPSSIFSCIGPERKRIIARLKTKSD